MPENLPDRRTQRVHDFLKKMQSRARLIFALDATASRQLTWDRAAQLTSAMFEEAARIGGLEVQLVYYRGPYECSHSSWTLDAHALTRMMGKITCEGGYTKIAKVLAHVRQEHQRQKVAAVCFVGDAMEESHGALCDAAAGLGGVPLLMFQEGDDPDASRTFAQMARLSNGAHCRFDDGAAHQLAELLRAVAAFAAGGLTALSDLKSEAGMKLLGQMKK